MHRRTVLIVTGDPEKANKLASLFAVLDAVIEGSNWASSEEAFMRIEPDLVVFDLSGEARDGATTEKLSKQFAPSAQLYLIRQQDLSSFRLPRGAQADFVVVEATKAEYVVRTKGLLWPGEESGNDDLVRDGRITLNLATYQVYVDDDPLDLTYLEYSLLAFLVSHPNRTYSRDVLLQRVWGFDYLGGTRTVDVHVRRLRAKLGPELSQNLETVRGVGYFWNAE